MNTNFTRFGWLMLAVFLAALDLFVLTMPVRWGFHAGELVTFGLAVLALVCIIIAYLTNGPKTQGP